MQNGKMIAIMGLVSVVLLVGGVLMFTRADQAKPEPKPVDQNRLVKDDNYKTASGSAQVMVVEFADFQCPACAESAPIVKQVLDEYGDKVNLVYRHFPLNQHKNAFVSGESAEAARAQGEVWEIGESVVIVSGKTLYGRAAIRVEDVEKAGLSVMPDDNPPRHANIIGWPDEKSERKLFAERLVGSAQLILH